MDEQLLIMINQGWAHPALDIFFKWVSTRLGFALPVLLTILTVLLYQHRRDGFKLWLLLVGLVILGDQFGNLLKSLFSQPRPCAVVYELIRQPLRVTGESCGAMTTGMPSNHAMNFFLVAAFMGSVMRSWRWALPLLLIAASVGLSRIYLGVHYPSQVLAGSVLGCILGLLAGVAAVKYLPFTKKIHQPRDI